MENDDIPQLLITILVSKVYSLSFFMIFLFILNLFIENGINQNHYRFAGILYLIVFFIMTYYLFKIVKNKKHPFYFLIFIGLLPFEIYFSLGTFEVFLGNSNGFEALAIIFILPALVAMLIGSYNIYLRSDKLS